MVIKIVSNYTDIDAELDRVGSMPTIKMLALLEGPLEAGFTTTQAVVHVRTGKLKASGNEETEVKDGIWTGMFSFPAPNRKGTPYGVYEIARGGPHNFTEGWSLINPLIGSAIVEGLKKS